MSFFTDPPLHDFPDRAHRLLLEHPDNLRELIGAAAPELAGGFLFSRARKLDRTLPLPDWRRRESDLLFSIPWQGSAGGPVQEALVCLLVEQQSQEDAAMPLRTLLYAVLFWEREWKQWEDRRERGAPLRLTPVLPIIFHTGRQPWTAPRGLPDLFVVPDALQGEVLPWRPRFWDLPTLPLDALRAADGEWLRAMAVVRAEREDRSVFHEVAEEVYHRLAPLGAKDRIRWHDLMWFLVSWSIRRRPSEERQELTDLAAAAHKNAIQRREVEQMTQVAWKSWEEEVMDVGMARGALKTSQRLLRGLLEQRFGALPETLLKRIEQTEDLKRLDDYVLQILKLKSLDEVQL